MEIIVLIGIAVLVFLSAAVQHASTALARGVGFVMSDRSEPLPETGFTGRARRTLQNTLESSAMMAPLAVVALVTGAATPVTQAAGAVYLAARLTFCLAYWLGISLVRSLSWAAGMAAIAVTFTVLTVQLLSAAGGGS
ncbi:MAPEG family protein [Roseibium sp. Sym1]|uniref:MAPEG family protein n=1 Tax=Roseibium sp. Sym1 TaxID=3016006 RepID=UPI0022B3909F|nr:MAPEG family protein [Roseibium sp. Sym1]